jgi:hypothetical protein
MNCGYVFVVLTVAGCALPFSGVLQAEELLKMVAHCLNNQNGNLATPSFLNLKTHMTNGLPLWGDAIPGKGDAGTRSL